MKKVLFGSTALLAAAAFTGTAYADKIELSVGGKQEFWFGVADVDGTGDDDDSWGGTGINTDTELYFTGQTTLDNGLTVKAVVQLEADESTTNADETYMVLSGGFGALQLGIRQGAHANLANTGMEQGGQDWDEAYFSGNWSPTPDDFLMGDFNTSLTYYSSDDASIAYISPEFFGFSVGATYTPDVDGTGLSDYDDASTGIKDQFDAAIAFSNEFYGIGVDADFGYLYGFGSAGAESYEMFRVGGALSYAGFSISGAWADHEYDGDTKSSGDGYAWQVGAGYENGPYGIDFNYARAEAEGDLITGTSRAAILRQTAAGVGEEETVDHFKATGRYDLGPGISLSAAVYHINYDNDTGEDRKITGGIMGVALSF